MRSRPAKGGLRTVLNYRVVGTIRYFDAAGFPGERWVWTSGQSPSKPLGRTRSVAEIGRPRDLRYLGAGVADRYSTFFDIGPGAPCDRRACAYIYDTCDNINYFMGILWEIDRLWRCC